MARRLKAAIQYYPEEKLLDIELPHGNGVNVHDTICCGKNVSVDIDEKGRAIRVSILGLTEDDMSEAME